MNVCLFWFCLFLHQNNLLYSKYCDKFKVGEDISYVHIRNGCFLITKMMRALARH